MYLKLQITSGLDPQINGFTSHFHFFAVLLSTLTVKLNNSFLLYQMLANKLSKEQSAAFDLQLLMLLKYAVATTLLLSQENIHLSLMECHQTIA